MRTVVASVLLVLLVALSTALAQAAPGPGRPDVPTVPAEFAAGEYQAFLEGVEKSFAATWPAQRLGAGADVLVFAATAAHVLGADTAPDWGERLYGERTKGRQAFDIVVGFQSGRFEQVAELPLCFSEAERKTRRTTPWGPLADALDAAAGAAPERQNWRDTATALRMAGFIRGGTANTDPQQPEKRQAGSEPCPRRLRHGTPCAPATSGLSARAASPASRLRPGPPTTVRPRPRSGGRTKAGPPLSPACGLQSRRR